MTFKTDPGKALLRAVALCLLDRTGLYNGRDTGSLAYYNWFAFEFWRFVFVQQEVAKLAKTALEFPPMQKGASFNLQLIKEQLDQKMAAQSGQ